MKAHTKKLLLITYYWPPSGGAGVQRWLKTVKYLHEMGWEITVFTPENPEIPASDTSLLREVPDTVHLLKLPIWEPYQLYQMLSKGKKNHGNYLQSKKSSGWASKLFSWARANLLIPDPRKFWIRPAYQFLKEHLKNHPVDFIISTGPPHSMHLIAQKLKKETSSLWLADFRDPWSFIDFFHHLPLTARSFKKHLRLEERVIKTADVRTIVSPSWKKQYEDLYGEPFDLIYNGFDPADFINKKSPLGPPDHFTICHIGSLNIDREPKVLWEVLCELCQENEQFEADLKVKLIGIVNPETLARIETLQLSAQLVHIPYMAHDRVLDHLMNSSVLLLLLNNAPNVQGIIPGKLFEYLAASKHILALGSNNSDSTAIIHTTQSGKCFGWEEKDALKHHILALYSLFKKGNTALSPIGIDQYSRKKQAQQFDGLMREALNKQTK